MIERYSLPRMSGIWKDENKFRIMLDIELLTCQAQSEKKLVPKAAFKRIRSKARFNVKRINELEKKTRHDIVAFVANVAENLGSDARYLHMGLTSSDLLDTTLGVQLSQASGIIIDDLQKLLASLAKGARRYRDTVQIGRTHGVHAEPITFGLKLALWYDETRRNLARMRRAAEEAAVGKLSGAVGTYSNIDPDVELYVCKRLGLAASPVSNQVIQRDIYAQFLATLAVIAGSLEQFATEIRHLQRTEVLEAEEPFGEGQKGSSAMPHKRNPVVCERICGMSRLLRGNAMAGLENIALWHERDISHSSVERVIMPDSTIALDYMLVMFTEVIDGLVVNERRMSENLERTRGLVFSQRVLLALMEKGLPRPQAYDLVQRCAMKTWRENSGFRENLLADADVSRYLTPKDMDTLFDLRYYLRNIGRIFGRLGLR